MILTQDARTIDTNVDQSQVFKIKTTAQAFKILSSNLYSNKIRAIVRELSCNAVDSHKLANNPDNFQVHLPTTFDPYFSVRDFGVGLSETDVFELYTSYFESTKSQSNDFIGALGLGSKSPFSYVDSFTIESIYNGEKKDYSAYISEAGVPTISLLNTTPCDGHNGIEVKIPVAESDFRRFKQEAEIVFYAFPVTPIITGAPDFIDYKAVEKDIIRFTGTGWRMLKQMPGPISNGAYGCQGCINYPLNEDILMENAGDEAMKKKLYFLFRNSFVVDFPLGSLDIAASREEISYDAKTVKTILSRLTEVYNEFVKDFDDKINSLSLYDAIDYYRSSIMQIGYGSRLTFTHRQSSAVIDSDSRIEIQAPFEYIIAQENDNSPYGLRLGRHPLNGEQKLYIHPNKKDKLFIVEDEGLKDLKFREKLRYYLSDKNNDFSFPATVVIVKLDQVQEIHDRLGNPPLVNLSSITLPEVPVAWKAPKQRETEPNFCPANSLNRSFGVTFFDLQDSKPKYYIINHDSEHMLWKTGRAGYRSTEDGTPIKSYWMGRFFDELRALSMYPTDTNFYVVRKKEIGYKRFKEDSTFCSFDVYLEKWLNDYIDSHEKRILNLFSLHKKIEKYQSIGILKESKEKRNATAYRDYFWNRIPADNELKKAYLMVGHVRTKELTDSFYSVVTNDCMPETTKIKLRSLQQKAPDVTDIDRKYPMLRYVEFSSYSVDREKLATCVEYVNSIAKEVI